MAVVADTSPLIVLATSGHLDLLQRLYDGIEIPVAVYDEVVVQGGSRPGARQIASASWITVHTVEDNDLLARLTADLDRGEAEAIALALERAAQLLPVDERRARRVAKDLGLDVGGVARVLLSAKARRLIGAVKPLLDQMVSSGSYRISEALYLEILRIAGE